MCGFCNDLGPLDIETVFWSHTEMEPNDDRKYMFLSHVKTSVQSAIETRNTCLV
jgi:hypothetical protein